MSKHILNVDLPKHPKGSIINIPDEQISITLKGKGYFIQVFKDSEILTAKYPDLFYKADKTRELYAPGYTTNQWPTFYHDTGEGHGTFTMRSDDHNTKETHPYEYFIANSDIYVPIDLNDHNDIYRSYVNNAGLLVWKYLSDGNRVLGFTTANSGGLSTSGDFNRFVAVTSAIGASGTYTIGTNYNKGSVGYYQYVKEDQLNDQLKEQIESVIAVFKKPDYNISFNLRTMRVERDEKNELPY